MERYSLFLDWKNQIVENDYTIQSNIQTQCNPFLIANASFREQKILQFVWKHKIP